MSYMSSLLHGAIRVTLGKAPLLLIVNGETAREHAKEKKYRLEVERLGERSKHVHGGVKKYLLHNCIPRTKELIRKREKRRPCLCLVSVSGHTNTHG